MNDLFHQPEPLVTETQKPTHRDKFWQFHRANLFVFAYLYELAVYYRYTMKFAHYGMKALVEEARYKLGARLGNGQKFKISNNHTAFYARLLVTRYPEFDGWLTINRQRSADKVARDGSTAVDDNWRDSFVDLGD